MLVTANKSTICFDYYNTHGKRIDSSVRKP